MIHSGTDPLLQGEGMDPSALFSAIPDSGVSIGVVLVLVIVAVVIAKIIFSILKKILAVIVTVVLVVALGVGFMGIATGAFDVPGVLGSIFDAMPWS